jgi:hypothetical protein
MAGACKASNTNICVAPILHQSHSAHCVIYFAPLKMASIEYIYKTGKKGIGCKSTMLGKLLPDLPKDIHFCGLFRVSTELAQTTWELMEEHGLCPSGSEFLHFFGHLCSCDFTPQTTTLSHVCWGDMIPRPSVRMYGQTSGQLTP